MTKSTTRIAALAFALAGLFVCAARADVRELVSDGKVSWSSNATVIYLKADGTPATADAYDHLVLKFTDTTAAGSLTIDDSVRANARVLVVGGGGAGGTSTSTTAGAGGGGGAGGFVETNMTLTGNTYSIVVGAGGAAATSLDTPAAGGDGSSSSFATIVAAGGGGGGAQSVGNDGASGGGGSYSSGTCNGGTGEAGQGNAGGSGKAAKFGAGGGGAEKSGGASSSVSPGSGGKGIASDILLDETGAAITYAGGGGGGSGSAIKGTGGKGGGGAGAVKDATSAGNGEDGFGGGGGGGANASAGGAGGSGVVIVRITQLVEIQVGLPTISAMTFNKGNQVALDFGIAYTYVSGTTNATEAGTYSFVVKPGPDLEWNAAAGGGTGEKPVNWSIAKRTLSKPTAVTGLVYDGTEKVGVTYEDADLTEYCTFDASSVTNATNAGDYTYSVSLNDTVNTTWSDNSTEAVEGTWSIAAQTVAVPTPKTGLVYDGNEKQGFDSLDYDRYELTAGETSATAGGAHQFTFSLLGNGAAVNYVWDTDPVSSAPYSGEWTIAPAANAVTKPELAGWRIGATPNVPTATATWGEVKYAYVFGEDIGNVSDWVYDTAAVNVDGIWTVIAMVDATASWSGATNTSQFAMWDDPSQLFRDHVDIKISAPTGATGTLTNFPALVRISEDRFYGFSYERAGSDSSKLSFLDGAKNPLPYEVETWNTSGESLIWVRVPLLPPEGATITMYWCLKDGRTPPENNPAEVWSEYVVVIHGGNTITNAVGNNLAVKPGATGSVTADLSLGVVAGSLKKGTSNTIGLLVNNPSPKLNNAGVFSVSGWYRRDGNGGNSNGTHILGGSKSAWGGTESGYLLIQEQGKMISIATASGHVWGSDMTKTNLADKTWGHIAFSYNNPSQGTNTGTLDLYFNGDSYLSKNGSINNKLINTTGTYWTFGSYCNKASTDSLKGNMDELRIYNGAASADWIKAEYETVVNEDFTSQGSAVSIDGLKRNYWVSLPAMDKTDWDASETPGAITNFGALAFGGVSNIIYSVYDPTQTFENTTDITATGYYRAVFLPTETEGYEPISHTVDIHVIKSQPYTKIGGTNGDSGRVLLMNRDTNEGCPIQNQGWDTKGKASSTFWEFINTDGTGLPYNLQTGTECKLWTKNYGERLWHLVDCRHGNTYPAGAARVKDVNGKIIPATAGTSVDLLSTQNYLPYSSTSFSIKQSVLNKANPSTAGQIVMRNTENATVYSSCFTDGIGTIYFDALNGWCRPTEDYDNYKLVVEIATNTVAGLAPSDENSVEIVTTTNIIEDVEVITVTTNLYGYLEGQWKPAAMIPFKRDGTANFEKCERTEELTLDVQNGGTVDNFFRVVVPLDIHGPVRFRIRRATEVPHSGTGSFGPDEGGFILLDNIIASLPAMRGDLFSAGHFDETKSNETTLGWELAANVPYPSKEDESVIGYVIYHD